MPETKINHKEWYVPIAFILCFGWLAWHFPFFTLDFMTPEDPSLLEQLSSQMMRNDVTPCLLYTSPSPRDHPRSRMPSSA